MNVNRPAAQAEEDVSNKEAALVQGFDSMGPRLGPSRRADFKFE